MTFEEVQKNNGENRTPIYFGLNGKVIEYVGTDPAQIESVKKNSAGKHTEVRINKMLYDPKYGCHDKIEDFSQEHRAVLEDFIFAMDNTSPQLRKAIAKLA